MNKVSGTGLGVCWREERFFLKQRVSFLPLLLLGWTIKDGEKKVYTKTRGSYNTSEGMLIHILVLVCYN